MKTKQKGAMSSGFAKWKAAVKKVQKREGCGWQQAVRIVRNLKLSGRKLPPGQYAARIKSIKSKGGHVLVQAVVTKGKSKGKPISIHEPYHGAIEDKRTLSQRITAFVATLEEAKDELQEQVNSLESKVEDIDELIERINETEIG